ncbi:MAG: hypothetical protein J2P45_17955 [Candidatus Dormibacteraeota bacterium]|nr:hypothetical protein [Candidatus Dormibacteraeota bacterium]
MIAWRGRLEPVTATIVRAAAVVAHAAAGLPYAPTVLVYVEGARQGWRERWLPEAQRLARYMESVTAYSWRWQRRRLPAWALTVAVMGVMLSVAASTQLMVWLSQRSLNTQLQSASQMQVFLSDGASAGQVSALVTKLTHVPGVKQPLAYRSKEEAAGFAHQNEQLQPLAAASNTNPFPASLVMNMDNPQTGQKVLKAVKGDPIVDPVVPGSITSTQSQQLGSALDLLQAGSVLLDVLALGVAGLVTVALLRGEIRSRVDELRILTLVGVPRLVIRLPLVFQALSVALVGGLIGALSVFWVSSKVVPAVSSSLPFLQLGNPGPAPIAFAVGTVALACLTLVPCSLLVRLPR